MVNRICIIYLQDFSRAKATQKRLLVPNIPIPFAAHKSFYLFQIIMLCASSVAFFHVSQQRLWFDLFLCKTSKRLHSRELDTFFKTY